MEAGQFARALNRSVAEGALATLMQTLLGGVFLTAFALHMGASELQIGLLAATGSLAHVAQLGGAWAIARLGQSKRVCLGASWIARLMWIPILLVPFLSAAPRRQQVWYIAGLLIVSSLFASIGAMAWLAWIKELVPQEIRLRFLARRHVFNTALAFSMSVAGGLLIDAWGSAHPDSLLGFVCVFATGMTCGLVGILILRRIQDAGPAADTRPPSLRDLWRRPLADTNFRRLIVFYGIWNFASNLATPFFAVYMLSVLQLSFTTVTLLLMLSNGLGVAATRLWTRFGDRFGTRNMVLCATMADVAYPLLWLLASPQTVWLVLPIHAWGVFSAPILMGPNALPLKLAPAQNPVGHLALFNAITGPLTACGAVIGGLLVGWGQAAEGAATGLQLVFALSAVGRLASLFVLRTVREPEARPVRQVVRLLQRAGRRRVFERGQFGATAQVDIGEALQKAA